MFDRAKRENVQSKVPGPGFYFQDSAAAKDEAKDKFTFPRQQRTFKGMAPRPDYDMSVFYADKGPGVKPKIGGYTISNTGGANQAGDPSTKNAPCVGSYETRHAYTKSTFHQNAPSYTVPQNGNYSIEACMQRASSPSKPMKKKNRTNADVTFNV